MKRKRWTYFNGSNDRTNTNTDSSLRGGLSEVKSEIWFTVHVKYLSCGKLFLKGEKKKDFDVLGMAWGEEEVSWGVILEWFWIGHKIHIKDFLLDSRRDKYGMMAFEKKIMIGEIWLGESLIFRFSFSFSYCFSRRRERKRVCVCVWKKLNFFVFSILCPNQSIRVWSVYLLYMKLVMWGIISDTLKLWILVWIIPLSYSAF